MNKPWYDHGLDSFQQALLTDSGNSAPIPLKVITDRGGATHDANLLKCGMPIGEAQDRYSQIVLAFGSYILPLYKVWGLGFRAIKNYHYRASGGQRVDV